MNEIHFSNADIDKVRTIAGFPVASDEDIIALSDAPRYTACPNPFIEQFITENGTLYDESTDDYSCEPYCEDVEENKHDLIYNIHKYHTKVPPKAIKRLICHYTKPGDIVFDGFCGSGMTGIAAQMCSEHRGDLLGRKAIINDIGSYATFIAANYNNPNDNRVISEMQEIIEEIKVEFGKYYQTVHVIGNQVQKGFDGKAIYGQINYVVWSNMYYCPQCSGEINYYKVMMADGGKSTQKMIKCPHCQAVSDRTKLDIKYELSYDERLGRNTELPEHVPVLINYSVGTKRFTKTPDSEDFQKLEEISKLKFKPYPTK